MATHVLLVGCTGNIGRHITQVALSQQFKSQIKLTLLVRQQTIDKNDEKSKLIKQYESQGATLLVCDLQNDSIDTLKQQLTDSQCNVVISCLNDLQVIDIQHKLIDTCVLCHNIQWFLPTEFAWNYDVIGKGSIVAELEDQKIDTRNKLKQLSSTDQLSYTIVCSGLFTEYYIGNPFAGIDTEKHTINAPGSIDAVLSVTTLEDNAKYICHMLCNGLTDHVKNQIVYFSDSTVSYKQTHQLLEQITGQKYTLQAVSVDDMLKQYDELKQQDKISDAQELGFRVLIGQQKGVSWDDSDVYNKQQGLQGTTVEQYIKDTLNK